MIFQIDQKADYFQVTSIKSHPTYDLIIYEFINSQVR